MYHRRLFKELFVELSQLLGCSKVACESSLSVSIPPFVICAMPWNILESVVTEAASISLALVNSDPVVV